MTARRFLGYDWFKLVVAVILVLLLLLPGLRGGVPAQGTAANAPPSAPAAAPTEVPTNAPTEVPTSAPTEVPTSTPTSAPTEVPTSTPTSVGGAGGPVDTPTLDVPSGGVLGAGNITLTGTGTPGSQVEVIVDGTAVGRATVGADGTWQLLVELAEGERQVVVRGLDSAGAVVAESSATSLAVGPAAPAGGTAPTATTSPAAGDAAATATVTAVPPIAGGPPALTFPTDGAQVPAGPLTLTGTGTAGAQVDVLDSDKLLGTVTVGADGTWQLPITATDGAAAYSVRPTGSQEVSVRPIRVTVGAGEQATDGTTLTVGGTAWVTRERGRSLRLRAAGGLNGRVITLLPVGTEVTLLEGPQPSDGYSWWRVRTLGGREGWVAGEELRAQPD